MSPFVDTLNSRRVVPQPKRLMAASQQQPEVRNRRLRRGVTQEEDASQLKLGEEFEHTQCLFISEVKILLEAQANNKDETSGEPRAVTNVLTKTLAHVQTFGRFTNRDAVREVRQLISKDHAKLQQFEIAQLANLCCEEAEEAKALIPSLHNKIEDEPLQELLKQMLAIKKYQS